MGPLAAQIPPAPLPAPGAPRRRPTKAAELLARQIEAEIAQRGWPVGALLGTEPELLRRYGVSRPVFREAVRLLEHHMVAESRRGAGGGLRVTAPDASAVADAAAISLDFRGVRVSQLFAARALLGRRCVERVAERADPAGRERLADLARQLSGLEGVALFDHAHDLEGLVADLTGDPVLGLFVEVLLHLADRHLPLVEHRSRYVADVERMRRAQLRILEATRKGRVEEAAERMDRWLQAAASTYRRWLREGAVPAPGTVAVDPVRSPAAPSGASPTPRRATGSGGQRTGRRKETVS
jgi:DNA-binding FadR family transcriptional regulator